MDVSVSDSNEFDQPDEELVEADSNTSHVLSAEMCGEEGGGVLWSCSPAARWTLLASGVSASGIRVH